MISFSRISKQYGRQVLFVDASFQLNPGEKVGLVGPNGSGKTTLFRMIVGEEVAGRRRRVGAEEADHRLLPAGRRGDVGPLGARRGDSRQRPRRRSPSRARAAAERDVGSGARRRHGPHPRRASARCRRSTTISAATRSKRRRAKCCTASGSTTIRSTATSARSRAAGRCASRWRACCSAGPDVLLMDEPTNHLDIESIIWLESFLKSLPGALLMTSHDREFMNRIVSEDRRDRRRRDHVATPATTISTSASARSARPTARRRTRASRRCSRRSSASSSASRPHAAKAAQVQSRVKALEKIEKIELPKKRQVVKFDFRHAATIRRAGRGARRRHQGVRPARRARRPEPARFAAASAGA